MNCDFDVIIVGGGPAGLGAGIQLAQNGIHTLICEKSSYPIDKACGEGIMPTGVVHLRRLGAFEHISDAHSYPFRGIRYFGQNGSSATGNFPLGMGIGFRRIELSRALMTKAQTMPKLELHANTEILSIERNRRRVLVHSHQGQYSAHLLIGADGIRSGVRRWAQLDGRPSRLRRWGANQHFAVKPWSQYVEVYYQPGIEAYVTPCGTEQIGVAFLWDRDRYTLQASGNNLIVGILSQFTGLNERLKNATVIGKTQSIGPLHRRVSSPIADNIALIGDAAGYLDPITGEGISLGLSSANLLCDFVTPIFSSLRLNQEKNPFSKKALEPFAQALKKQTRFYYLTTYFMLKLIQYPRLMERMIKELKKHPVLFDRLLMVNMGHSKVPDKNLLVNFQRL